MAEPQIVPPPPAVNQPTGPVDNSPGMEQVQRAFDQVYPDPKPKPAAPPQPEPQPEPEPAPAPIDPDVKPEKIPSFLEKVLEVDEPQRPADRPPPVEEDFPEEPPAFKTDEERKSRYKKWRDTYKATKDELAALKQRASQPDETSQARMAQLEEHNQQMQAVLSRMGVEQHQEFQQQVIQPLTAAWNEAAKIVHEAGGDVESLAQAMGKQGREQFEALDEIFEDIPESAKIEAHEALRQYRHLDQVRQQALAQAPQTMEALRKRDLQAQYKVVQQQREEMKSLFEDAVRTLRDDAKVEVLLKSKDPDAAKWNQQADDIIENARQLYLENTDMRKMAMAAVLAPMADAFRKLWMSERIQHQKTRKMLKERFGAEPSMSESSGGSNLTESQLKDDLKKPFADVFLREFHRSRGR